MLSQLKSGNWVDYAAVVGVEVHDGPTLPSPSVFLLTAGGGRVLAEVVPHENAAGAAALHAERANRALAESQQ
jgi:hypothetical protein